MIQVFLNKVFTVDDVPLRFQLTDDQRLRISAEPDKGDPRESAALQEIMHIRRAAEKTELQVDEQMRRAHAAGQNRELDALVFWTGQSELLIHNFGPWLPPEVAAHLRSV